MIKLPLETTSGGWGRMQSAQATWARASTWTSIFQHFTSTFQLGCVQIKWSNFSPFVKIVAVIVPTGWINWWVEEESQPIQRWRIVAVIVPTLNASPLLWIKKEALINGNGRTFRKWKELSLLNKASKQNPPCPFKSVFKIWVGFSRYEFGFFEKQAG
jgi:hypothetical protein